MSTDAIKAFVKKPANCDRAFVDTLLRIVSQCGLECSRLSAAVAPTSDSKGAPTPVSFATATRLIRTRNVFLSVAVAVQNCYDRTAMQRRAPELISVCVDSLLDVTVTDAVLQVCGIIV